jgi:hypothetical protein
MQASWRQDADKLTFIICTAPDGTAWSGEKQVTPGKHDVPDCMIGDVVSHLPKKSFQIRLERIFHNTQDLS